MSGLRDAMFGDTESTVFSVLDTGKQILPMFGPYGQIAAGVIATGEGIYDAATGKKYGAAPPGGVVQVSITGGGAAAPSGRRPGAGVAPPGLARLRKMLSAPPVAKSIKTVVVEPPPPAHGAKPIGSSSGAGTAVAAAGAGLALAALLKVL